MDFYRAPKVRKLYSNHLAALLNRNNTLTGRRTAHPYSFQPTGRQARLPDYFAPAVPRRPALQGGAWHPGLGRASALPAAVRTRHALWSPLSDSL